jgi:hypothetical protein
LPYTKAQGKLALGFYARIIFAHGTIIMPLETPWNDWYHCNGNTYGTWLPGDPRGFRERHHRRHIDGDYKNPPPPGAHDDQLNRSRRLMKKEAVLLNPRQREVAVQTFAEKLLGDEVELLVLAINDHHFHLLARFRDRQPKHWIGRAKMHASMLLRDHDLPGRVWAAGCRTLPICDRKHQLNVFNYIARHRRQGASVWTFRDAANHASNPKPNPVPSLPTKARGKPATGTQPR